MLVNLDNIVTDSFLFPISGSGGMLMDPFRTGGMGSTGRGGLGPPPLPGQLPRLF